MGGTGRGVGGRLVRTGWRGGDPAGKGLSRPEFRGQEPTALALRGTVGSALAEKQGECRCGPWPERRSKATSKHLGPGL